MRLIVFITIAAVAYIAFVTSDLWIASHVEQPTSQDVLITENNS